MRSLLSTAATALALAALGQPAFAQSAETTEANDRPLDTITVSAQRRDEGLQDVPAAVTALGQTEIEARQVSDVLDLQFQVPNINIATNTGTANAARIFLRGIGEDESRGAVDPAVGIYVDGVYIGRVVGALFDLVDVERIEVLRGPQGTLYGRNSNGGAIRLVSVAPQDEHEFSAKAVVGNEGRLDLRGVANLAFSEDTAGRITILDRKRDGLWRLTPNGPLAGNARDVGEVDVFALRGSLRHRFNEDWSATLILDHTADESDPIPDSAAPTNDADGNVFTIEPVPGVTCSSATPATLLPLGCFSAYNNETISSGVSVSVDGQLFGHGFASITGYREMEDDLSTRIGFPYLQQTDQDQISQEFTFTSNNAGPFNYVAGVYLFQEDLKLDTTFVFPFSIDTSTEAAAVFAHGTLDAAGNTITAGVRYTDETKDFQGANLGLGLTRTDTADFDTWNYNIGIDRRLNEAALVYASYSTGSKSGGWSPDCFSGTACFLPVTEEEVRSFEVGARLDLGGGRLRLNPTYFFNTYEGLQIGATVPGLGFTRFNVAETEIQGFELEARLRATDQLEFFGNLGLLSAEYTSVTQSQAAALTNNGASCPGGVPTIDCALGLELKNAPEYKYQIGANFTQPVFGGELFITGDINVEDDSWSLVANGPPHALSQIPTLYNARIAYSPDQGPWSVALFGQNLSDEVYWRSASAGSFTTYASPGRLWGVELGVEF